jgi:hypothetical protein
MDAIATSRAPRPRSGLVPEWHIDLPQATEPTEETRPAINKQSD